MSYRTINQTMAYGNSITMVDAKCRHLFYIVRQWVWILWLDRLSPKKFGLLDCPISSRSSIKDQKSKSLRSSFSLYAQFIPQYIFFLYRSVSLKMLNIWTPGLSLKLPRIAIFRAFNLRAEKTDYCKKNPSVFPFDHSILFSPSLTLFSSDFFCLI